MRGGPGQPEKERPTKSPRKFDRAAAKGKGLADVSKEPPTLRRKPKLVRELCSASARVDGRDYHAIRMCNLPEKAPDAPLEVDLRPLTHGMLVWQNGEASAKYIQVTLIPRLTTDLYTLPSKVLMDGAAKAMVLGQLRSARTQVRQMETELLELTRSKDALREDLPRKTIEDYKKSPGFEMGQVRMGRVSLEYRY
ncbi:hypothetical protein BHE74_00030267 [Ensete ventricosum]|nr:hypothetical protein BHE74_00030267 [Ensete ventricosum]